MTSAQDGQLWRGLDGGGVADPGGWVHEDREIILRDTATERDVLAISSSAAILATVCLRTLADSWPRVQRESSKA